METGRIHQIQGQMEKRNRINSGFISRVSQSHQEGHAVLVAETKNNNDHGGKPMVFTSPDHKAGYFWGGGYLRGGG